MYCYGCRARVANMAALRTHFRASPACPERIEERALLEREHELGAPEDLLDDRLPLSRTASRYLARHRGMP